MLSAVENARLRLSKTTDGRRKSELGQFLTPASTAAFMAGLFPKVEGGTCRLLDAGAGIGSLASAFLERWVAGDFQFRRVEVDAFEIDSSLHDQLVETLSQHLNDSLRISVHGGDFVSMAAEALSGGLFSPSLPRYSHAILNPPYKKIGSQTAHRAALRRAGIETVNLYAAFVALALAHLAPGGQLVAIIPRSFCNGPYYRPFRDYILERAAIRHLHLFESRSTAFKDDGVLQENIVVRLEREGRQGPVTVSSSTDDTFFDLMAHDHPFEQIVPPTDIQRFIHVPTVPDQCALERAPSIRYSLAELGLTVSTGPVVDFRLREHLRDMPTTGSVPLLYPGHFSQGEMVWPIERMKKPNAIDRNSATEKWLYPTGHYCVVRRFSSKEEKRRIVASTVDPHVFGDMPALGFENHLNVFHEQRGGLPKALARGLTVFLNSSIVDESFRRFNGHTQVNATDLRQMKYPSRGALIELGEWAKHHRVMTQELIDERFGTLTA